MTNYELSNPKSSRGRSSNKAHKGGRNWSWSQGELRLCLDERSLVKIAKLK